MSKPSYDEVKRRWVLGAAQALGLLGLAGFLYPLLRYLAPSREAQAQGAPVRVDVSGMRVGEQKTVLWRGKPVWIVKRSLASVDALPDLNGDLRDPFSHVQQQPIYAQNTSRSVRPDFLVLLGVCTHLGCAPTYRPEPGAIDAKWPGGFYCSCHGSKFDLAGRVFKNMPAPTNLEVPPHHFEQDMLIIGDEIPGYAYATAQPQQV